MSKIGGGLASASAIQMLQRNTTQATTSSTTRTAPGTPRRQMKRSIMFSASKFSAHRGQPRAFCSSRLPQSRQIFVLITIVHGPGKYRETHLLRTTLYTTLLAQVV